MNIQDEVAKIHHQYGTSEMANYQIQKLFESMMVNHLPDDGNVIDHFPDTGNKVAEDSFTKHLSPDELEYHGGLTVLTKEELEAIKREMFNAGRDRVMTGLEEMVKFDDWQSTRDNSSRVRKEGK